MRGIGIGLHRLAATLSLVGTLHAAAGCVLPPPVHGIALTLDATAIVAGAGMMITDEDRGGGENSGITQGGVGAIVLGTGLTMGAITLLIYAMDRPITREARKEPKVKTAQEWSPLAPSARALSWSGTVEQPVAATAQ